MQIAQLQNVRAKQSRIRSKKVAVAGDHLYLVEGSIRWGLYDLKTGTLTLLDKDSGDFISHLSEMAINPDQKRVFLRTNTPKIWEQINILSINQRIFESDTSIKPTGITMDLIWLEVTNTCNEQCVHCYAESKPTRKEFLSAAFAKKIIRQAYEENFQKLQFVGGEPFMHCDIWEIIRYACKFNFPEIEIYTNLTTPKEEDFERVKAMGIKIATSLLGYDQESHEACTKTPGSFESWYHNMKYVKKLEIPYRIGIVRMRQNENFMDNIEQFLRTEGFLSPDELFRPDDLRPVGRGNNISMLPVKPVDHEPYLTVTPMFFHQAQQYNPCWRGEIAVTADGLVYPCVFSRCFSIGNLYEQSLKEIIKKLKKSFWAITLDKVERCRDCELRYACMDCRALSLNTGKGLYSGPVRCDYNPYQ